MLKAENLQRTGSFKIRGAVNVLASLTPAERDAGVIAASAGNHGQAVAAAARELGVRATIVMPQDAPMSKVDPTLRYGAEAVLFGPTFDDALAEAHRRVEETGATLIHAFEDERVIAGQGTIGLELAEQLGDVETLLIPVGGGGLASGIAIVMRALRPELRLVGVHTERGAHTIADGIAVKYPGEMTMAILDDLLDELIVVGDEEISEAIALLLERTKLVVEGAGAVGVAALLTGKVGGTGTVCALLSGGNIDLDAADPGDAPRPVARRAHPRDPQPPDRSAGRADQPAPHGRRAAREHRRDRAPPRGDRAPGRGRRHRHHPDHA